MSQAALRISDIEVASFRSSENLSASVNDGELGVVQGEFGTGVRPGLDQSGVRHSVAGAFDMIIRTGNLVRTAREESRQAVDEANQVIEKAGDLVKSLEQRLEASEGAGSKPRSARCLLRIAPPSCCKRLSRRSAPLVSGLPRPRRERAFCWRAPHSNTRMPRRACAT